MLTLQDSLIRLTPLTIDHFDAMLRIAEECPETWQYTPNNAHGADNMHRYIQSALVNRAAGKHLPFAIEHRPDSRIIGSTRFYHIDKHHQTVNIGYTWLHSDFRGRSINKRAKFLLPPVLKRMISISIKRSRKSSRCRFSISWTIGLPIILRRSGWSIPMIFRLN